VNPGLTLARAAAIPGDRERAAVVSCF